MSLEVNYKHIKVTRGKKLTTQPKNIFFCKYTQMTIRSHIGYVRLLKKHWRLLEVTQGQKLIFKRGRKI